MLILIDADIFCYRIGFACETESESVACSTMSSYLTNIIEDVVMDSDDEEHEVELYLTGSDNFRFDYAVTAEYKGNRKKNKKPQHISALRDHLIAQHGAVVTQGEETDDRIAIRATQEPDAIIVSLDKDFYQLVCGHYNFVKKELFYITKEEAIYNFYMQFLVGDAADNIKGVQGIGPKKAAKLLEGKTELEMYAICVEKLGSEERALENGILLHLRRKDDEIWQPPKPVTTDDGQKLGISLS
jgi:5'-3' exonuclease|tara:strand:+ start:2868 stop:3596 length:729 start_codon:yes stop_codon:yes gene_type:complete